MKSAFAIISILALITPAIAQQNADPEFQQQAIAALQAQRNNSEDALAAATARESLLNIKLSKANDKIKELENKLKDKVSASPATGN